MVRVGDEFLSGVLVSAADVGAAPLTVTITATITPPAGNSSIAKGSKAADGGTSNDYAIQLAAGSPVTREVTLTPSKQQREVRFRFSAAAVGGAGLRFDAYLGSSKALQLQSGAVRSAATVDSASFDVPVLGRQPPVFLATSFALQPASSPSISLSAAGGLQSGQAEGLALPAADPGSGYVDLVAGVGNLPFVKVRGAGWGRLLTFNFCSNDSLLGASICGGQKPDACLLACSCWEWRQLIHPHTHGTNTRTQS